jgi:hypothetical protein
MTVRGISLRFSYHSSVCEAHLLGVPASPLPADIEIEELEFGLDEPGLADDVDDGADSDPEALDSDSGEEDEIILNEGDEADRGFFSC